jgi:transcriptional regulator with XRE-family HTH domain
MDLRSYLSECDKSVPEFERELGVSATAVQRYLEGVRTPRPTIMKRIAHLTDGKVQPNDFFQDARPQRAA